MRVDIVPLGSGMFSTSQGVWCAVRWMSKGQWFDVPRGLLITGCNHGITEYPELERTHEDHCVQILAMLRTTPRIPL